MIVKHRKNLITLPVYSIKKFVAKRSLNKENIVLGVKKRDRRKHRFIASLYKKNHASVYMYYAF